MRLLLDTNSWIWLSTGSRHLSQAARAQIADAEDVMVSLVVAWEISIAQALGRLREVPVLPLDAVSARFPVLPILPHHIALLPQLPLHHRDPFDRMLVAQAQAEGMVIVTADRAIRAYDVAVLPA